MFANTRRSVSVSSGGAVSRGGGPIRLQRSLRIFSNSVHHAIIVLTGTIATANQRGGRNDFEYACHVEQLCFVLQSIPPSAEFHAKALLSARRTPIRPPRSKGG